MNVEKIFQKVAEQNNTTLEEVRKEIQYAIDIMYENPNEHSLKISKNGNKPTPEELYEYVYNFVKQLQEK